MTKIGGREVEKLDEKKLDYPGEDAPPSFDGTADGQSMDEEFKPSDTPKVDPPKEEPKAKEPETKEEIPKAPSTPTAEEIAAKIPILKKFRESFGVDRIEPKYATVTRYVDNEPVTFTFGYRALNYEDWAWVQRQQIFLHEETEGDAPMTPDFALQMMWKLPIIAISVCAMDQGYVKNEDGTPLTTHFVDVVGDSDLADPYRANPRIRRLIASQMLTMFRGPLADIVMEMYDHYENLVEGEWREKQKAEEDAGPLSPGS